MPDTSPRGEGVPDEDPKVGQRVKWSEPERDVSGRGAALQTYDVGVGASFYVNATTEKYRRGKEKTWPSRSAKTLRCSWQRLWMFFPIFPPFLSTRRLQQVKVEGFGQRLFPSFPLFSQPEGCNKSRSKVLVNAFGLKFVGLTRCFASSRVVSLSSLGEAGHSDHVSVPKAATRANVEVARTTSWKGRARKHHTFEVFGSHILNCPEGLTRKCCATESPV